MPTTDQLPCWAELGDAANPYLSDLLSLASANYARQTDWFLRHRDNGLKNLAAIIGAETAVTGLYFTAQDRIPHSVLTAFLTLLAIFAVLLSWAAWRSCTRSFTASVESAALMCKAVWAMGLFSKVAVPRAAANLGAGPLRKDRHFYVDRWVSDAEKRETTDGYRTENLGNWENTYFLERVTIFVFCLGAVAPALVDGYAILFRA